MDPVRSNLAQLGQRVASSAQPLVNPLLDRLRRYEQVLAVLCLTIPLWLILFDTGPETVRGSISSYHDMSRPQAFYFPLTVAAMLFVTNGVSSLGRRYNVWLGVLLAGVVLVNHDGATRPIHIAFAVGFFVLNVLVILWFSQDIDAWLRYTILAAVVAIAALWIFVKAFTTFWAESASLTLVAVHFFLSLTGWCGYSTHPERHRIDIRT